MKGEKFSKSKTTKWLASAVVKAFNLQVNSHKYQVATLSGNNYRQVIHTHLPVQDEVV